MWPTSWAVSPFIHFLSPLLPLTARDISGTPGRPGMVLWLRVLQGALSPLSLLLAPLPWGRPQGALFAGALTASPGQTSPGQHSGWATRQPVAEFMAVSHVSRW